MTTTTWNPSDKSSGVTLSNSNLTATCNNGANSQGVRGNVSHSSGKWYIEFHSFYFASVGGPGGVGIANLSDSLTETSAGAFSNTDAAGIFLGKTIEVGNGSAGSSGIVNDLTGSNVAGVAVDMDAGLVWFTTDGTHWNNGGTANPATGVGGYSLTAGTPMGTAYPKAWIRWGLSGAPYDTATINGSGSFTFTIPSGFTQWDGAVLTGTWASTEADDAFSGAGGILGGSWHSTEAKDTMAFIERPHGFWYSTEAADVTNILGGIIGPWHSTETKDAMAFVGGVLGGSWHSTETKDAMAFTGYPAVTGVWSSIEITDAMTTVGLGSVATTFDPVTASPGIDFQKDDLTIENQLAFGQQVGAKSNTSQRNGKLYVEFTTLLNTNNSGVGIGNALATFTGWGNGTAVGPGNGPAASGAGCFSYENGSIWIDGVQQSNWAGSTALSNAVVRVAIDLDNDLIWFSVNGGYWNGIAGANPSNGIASPRPPSNQPQVGSGGYDISAITANGPIYLWAELVGGYDAVTLNAGGSAFAYSIPSGFVAWDSVSPASAPLQMDGYATAGNSEVVGSGPYWVPITETDVTLSTTQANDVIVVGVSCGGYYNLSTVTSITDTAGLIWKRRNKRYQTGGYKTGGSTEINQGLNIEIWWAHAPTALIGDVITINTDDPAAAARDVAGDTLPGNGSVSVIAFGVSGANYTTPWDTHTLAGGYVDKVGNLTYFPPTSNLYTKATNNFLFGLHGDVTADAGVTAAPWTYVTSATASEKDGYNSFVSLVYQVVEEPQSNTNVVAGITVGGIGVEYTAQSMMFDSIVAAGETGTDREIVWFWDPNSVSSTLQLSTGTTLQVSYSAANFNLMVLIEVAIMSASGNGTVTSISEGQGSLSSSGFERRSRKVTSTPLGPLTVEIWWGWMPMYTSGERANNDTITINTGGTGPGDIIGAQILGLGGTTGAFGLGDPFWDVNPAVPAANSNTSGSPPPYTTDISTTIPSDLVVAWTANNTANVPGYTDPFVTLVQHYPNTIAPIMQMNSVAPPFFTGFEFYYEPGLATSETAEFLQTPEPNGWIVIADAIPVGPPQPPTGTMHISDQQDKFTHTGDYSLIGIVGPGGWVVCPAIHGIIGAVEHADEFTGAPAMAPWFGEGWLGWVPGFGTWASTDHDDQMALYGWVLGFGITGQLGATETKDRQAFSNRATVTGIMGAVETKDRWGSAGLVLPPSRIHPTIPRKRRLLIVT